MIKYIYTYLYWLFRNTFIANTFRSFAITEWDEYYEINLQTLLTNTYRPGRTCVVFRCRVPYSTRTEVYTVWLEHPEDILDVELSCKKIILGQKHNEKDFFDYLDEVQKGGYCPSFSLASLPVLTKKPIYTGRFEVTYSLPEQKIFGFADPKTYTEVFNNINMNSHGTPIQLALQLEKRLHINGVHIYEYTQLR